MSALTFFSSSTFAIYEVRPKAYKGKKPHQFSATFLTFDNFSRQKHLEQHAKPAVGKSTDKTHL
jgi:hypothetical protein